MRNEAKLLEQSVVLIIVLAGILMASPSYAGSPSCTPFNDPGCFFGENFDDGDLTGWGWNSSENSINPNGFLNVAPGLLSTSRKLQHNYLNGYNSCTASTESCVFSGASISHTSPQGEVIWIEFRVKWQAGWLFGPGVNAHSKLLSLNFNDAGGCGQGRLLLEIVGIGGGYTTGYPHWNIYPNESVSSCNGTVVNVDGSATVTGGVEYHFVIAVKLQSNSGGYLKMWQNGVLVLNAQNVTTVPLSGTNHLNGFSIGGPQSGTHTNEKIWWDEIRFTTTNISGGSVAPQPPAAVAPPPPVLLP